MLSDAQVLTQNESDCLQFILQAVANEQTRSLLQAQVDTLVVASRTTMHTNLNNPSNSPAVGIRDGAFDVSATAFDRNDRPTGFVTVWVTDGLLSSMSFGWVTDEAPDDFPALNTLILDETLDR